MDARLTEKNSNEKPVTEKSSEPYRAPAVLSVPRVLKLVLILVVLIMFLNVLGLFSLLKGYFYLLVIAIAGFLMLIAATLAFRYVYRSDDRAKKSLPKLGWLLLGLVVVLIMGGAFPSSSRTLSMNEERTCEENLIKLGRSVERYVAEKGRLPETLDQLVKDRYLEYIPSIGKSAYLYRVDAASGKSSFFLICPDPGKLLKASGFLPAKKCRDIKYIQGRGLVVETK